MSLYVLDASVAVKWFLPAADEPLSEQAQLVLERLVKREYEMSAPDLLWVEFANTMWSAVRRNRLTREDAKLAMENFEKLAITCIPSRPLVPRSFGLALEFECSVYDCTYVALALDSGAQFLTADERLLRSLSPVLPTKWLGAIW